MVGPGHHGGEERSPEPAGFPHPAPEICRLECFDKAARAAQPAG